MDSGFYSAFTGFATRLDALEVVANNLANTNTPGYKASRAFYRSMPAWLQQSLSTPLNQAVNQFGVLGGAQLDLTVSNLEKTGNATDVALQGPGFFNIQSKAGLRFTRNGNFQLNTKRQLITSQGDLVLGDNGPIQLPSGELAISQDGTVSVDGGLVAKLKATVSLIELQRTAQLMEKALSIFHNEFNRTAAQDLPRV